MKTIKNVIADIRFYYNEYVVMPLLNIKYFFSNVKLFWNDLKNFRPWDHSYCIDIYCTALEALKEDIYRNSYEIDITRMKKVEAMEELLMLLQTDLSNNFNGLIKKRKNGTYDFSKYNKAVINGEELLEKRIFRLLGGQSDKEITKLNKNYEDQWKRLSTEHPDVYKAYKNEYNASEIIDDGTGACNWWD